MAPILITTRDYTLAHVEGQLYQMTRLGTLPLLPERQDVVRVDEDGKVYRPESGDRLYLLGRAQDVANPVYNKRC
ncbi:hypothetical protein AhyVDH1_043 [Aeromonas phage AhyVDH1]|nr:hypothetical protein AhyVDH1_043 [Aeromonas phage AhyVDH1]